MEQLILIKTRLKNIWKLCGTFFEGKPFFRPDFWNCEEGVTCSTHQVVKHDIILLSF